MAINRLPHPGMHRMGAYCKNGRFRILAIAPHTGLSLPKEERVSKAGLVGETARGYRPQRLDLAAANANIPVMNIAGRVAMARNQL